MPESFAGTLGLGSLRFNDGKTSRTLKMRTVIHIGAHKTATSLVQKYFRDRPEVRRALRIGYIGRDETNDLIGWGKPVQKHPERLRHRIEAELEKAPAAVFISHENSLGRPFSSDKPGLYPYAAERAPAIKSALDGLDLWVVFYVRPVPWFVESYYLQTVQQGAWHTFEEWYSKLDPASLRWSPLVETLDEVFGFKRVILGDFREIEQGQEEFLWRFIIRAGLPVPREINYPALRNASISDRGLKIALDMNRHLETGKERRVTRNFLQKHFNNTKGDRAMPMPESMRMSLRESTDDEYEKLAERSAKALEQGMREASYPTWTRWNAIKFLSSIRRKATRS